MKKNPDISSPRKCNSDCEKEIATAQLGRFTIEGMICISFPRGSRSGWAAINDYNDRSKFNDDLVARATIY